MFNIEEIQKSRKVIEEFNTFILDFAKKVICFREQAFFDKYGDRLSLSEYDPYRIDVDDITVCMQYYCYGESDNMNVTFPLLYINNNNWQELDKARQIEQANKAKDEKIKKEIEQKKLEKEAKKKEKIARRHQELKELARLKKKYEKNETTS